MSSVRLRSSRLLTPLSAVLVCAGCASTPSSYVLLIESPDGSTGQVQVTDAAGTRVLERARQAAALDGSSGKVLEIPEAQAQKDFGRAMAAQPPLPETIVVYFESSGTVITEESRRDLRALVARARGRPAAEIRIVGHTDTVGDLAFNDRLGLARARTVADALAADGVQALTVQLESRGERELAVPTADRIEEPRNRRVVVTLR